MISIKKMHKWVFEERNDLSFIFVDYKEQGDDLQILSESDPIPIEHISWDCLSIEAQGYGVIQKVGPLKDCSTSDEAGLLQRIPCGIREVQAKRAQEA